MEVEKRKTGASTELSSLLREIDESRPRTEIVLRESEEAIERWERVGAEIMQRLEDSQPALEEALDTLRKAGLLRD